MAKMKSYNLFIDGQDISTDRFDFSPIASEMIVNPRKILKTLSQLKKGEISSDDSVFAKYYLADEKHIDQAIVAANKAFHAFKKFPFNKRAQIIIDVHSVLKKKKDEFIALLIKEGHPYKLAVWQYDNMINGTSKENINYYMSCIRQRLMDRQEEIIITKKPDGVILVIPPRNAPASNSLVALASILIGNALIIKPPQQLPVSTIFLWREIIQEALEKNHCPKGMVNILQGNSSLIFEKCIESEAIKTVLIFGESEHGIELGKRAYNNSKKPILELSGNDIMVIWKDAKINEKLLDSSLEAFLGSTQICMVPKIFLIHHKIYDKYVESLKNNLYKVKVGLPNNKETWLSPVGKKSEYFKCLQDATDKGGIVLSGGKYMDHNGEEKENGMFIQPTLLKIEDHKSFMEMLCFQHEIFFPLIPLVRIGGPGHSDDEIAQIILDIIEKNRYGLRVSMWINDPIRRNMLVDEINNCGSIRINSRHIGFSKYLSTHGGTGMTGGPLGELNYMFLRAGHLQGVSITK